jgi:hypothetical protein
VQIFGLGEQNLVVVAHALEFQRERLPLQLIVACAAVDQVAQARGHALEPTQRELGLAQ